MTIWTVYFTASRGKMEHLSAIYFGEMFTSIEKAFDDINSALAANREELKDMSYRTQGKL